MDPSMPNAEVLLEHREFLRRLARGILHDADAAEDVAQEALVEGMRGRPRNPRGWLGKVAVRLALTRRRAEERRASRERAAARPEALPSAAEGVARLELQRRVVDAVLELDEPYQSVVVHRFFYDVTPTEIATLLKVPLETVRTRLRRALAILRARLDASHGRQAWSVALLALAAPRKLPLGGVLAMSLKTKLVAASLLLIACAFGVSALTRRERSTPRAPQQEARVAVEPEVVVPPGPPVIDFATIDRDRDVHGVVVDAQGSAVVDADIRVIRYPATGLGMLAQLESEEGPGTRTASDGSFALRVERGEEVDLRVNAAGFAPLQRRSCPAGGKVRIVVKRGVGLRVRVTDPDGKALPGAQVIAFKGKGPEIETSGVYVYLTGTADTHGLCVLTDLLPGREIQVAAFHADFDFPRPTAVKLPEAGEVEATLVGEPGRDVTGRVADATTGAAVAGATVTPYPVLLPFAKSVRTDADGRYRYGGWGGSERALFVHADGFASAREVVADRQQIDFALRRGGTVRGTVRDPSGAPLARAFVGAFDSDRTEIRETWSDASGRFELRDVGTGSRTLVAAKPGFGRAQKPIDAPEMEIVLAEPRRLEGRVLGPDGEPMQATVRVASKSLPIVEIYDRHTDDLGRFRFADLRSGAWAVSATASDQRQIGRDLTIADSDVLDFEFRYERGREFSVLVVDEARRPVPGVGLMSGSARKTTDNEGRATFEVPKGADVAQVIVSNVDPRFVRPPVANYKLGQGELTIVLGEAVLLLGRVLLDGEPLVGAGLTLEGQEFHDFTATDRQGRFSRAIPARMEVKVALLGQFVKLDGQGDEFLPIYGEATVPPGATEVTILARRVPLDRTLVVRVTGPDGTGVGGIQLSVGARGSRTKNPLTTDAHGRVELSGLPAGEISVALWVQRAPAPWAMPKTTHMKLVPEGQEVVFAFRGATAIRGVVYLPDGKPTKPHVIAWSGKEVVARATGEDDGTFAIYIATDEPGPIRLEAYGGPRPAGGVPAFGGVEGVSPGALDVTIRLEAK